MKWWRQEIIGEQEFFCVHVYVCVYVRVGVGR